MICGLSTQGNLERTGKTSAKRHCPFSVPSNDIAGPGKPSRLPNMLCGWARDLWLPWEFASKSSICLKNPMYICICFQGALFEVVLHGDQLENNYLQGLRILTQAHLQPELYIFLCRVYMQNPPSVLKSVGSTIRKLRNQGLGSQGTVLL